MEELVVCAEVMFDRAPTKAMFLEKELYGGLRLRFGAEMGD